MVLLWHREAPLFLRVNGVENSASHLIVDSIQFNNSINVVKLSIMKEI